MMHPLIVLLEDTIYFQNLDIGDSMRIVQIFSNVQMKIRVLAEAMQKNNRLPFIQVNANMDFRDLYVICVSMDMEKLIPINVKNVPVLNI